MYYFCSHFQFLSNFYLFGSLDISMNGSGPGPGPKTKYFKSRLVNLHSVKRLVSETSIDNFNELNDRDLNNNTQHGHDLDVLDETVGVLFRDASSQTDELFVNDVCIGTDRVRIRDASTQTNAQRGVECELPTLVKLNTISILCDSLRCSVNENWNCVSERIFSVVIYMIISMLKVGFRESDKILDLFNCINIKTAHRWALTLVECDDPSIILNDSRGVYKRDRLYDLYPELEQDAKDYAIRETSAKNCSFSVDKLSDFIHCRAQEIIRTDNEANENLRNNSATQLDDNERIRSNSAIRLDLTRWGAKWSKNNKRPYFEGHEREDVVSERSKLVKFLTDNKHRFYQQSKDDALEWIEPSEDKSGIIITHDECCVMSGEQQNSRWSFGFNAPFYNKNRGRTQMLSYFLCQHKYCGLFELSDDEWSEAVTAHPELLDDELDFNYDARSANASMEPGKNHDGYFDNTKIIKQFERLFILLKFKTIFRNNKIILFVDNARTHSAKKFDRDRLFKKSGTNCPYDYLEWVEDDGEKKRVSFFQEKQTKDKKKISKGLFVMCQDLGEIIRDKRLKSFVN